MNIDTMRAIVTELEHRGIGATLEYPNFINVPQPDSVACYHIGDTNTTNHHTLMGELMSDGEFIPSLMDDMVFQGSPEVIADQIINTILADTTKEEEL